MSRQQDFPLQQLKASLENIQFSLEKAEGDDKRDKELVEYINKTQGSVSRILERLKWH
jgi:hypothetical protein